MNKDSVQKKYSYKLKDEFKECTSDEIMTIENDCYSIRELLQKFTTGVFDPKSILRSGFDEIDYDPSIMESDNVEFVDRTDVQQYVNTMQKRAAYAAAKERKAKASAANEAKRSAASEAKAGVTETQVADQPKPKAAES